MNRSEYSTRKRFAVMTLVPYPERSAQARRRLRTLMMALLVGGLLAMSGNAFAQDDSAEQDAAAADAPVAAEEAAPEEAAPADAAPEEVATQDAAAEDVAPSAPTLQITSGEHGAIEEKMDSYW